MPFICEVWSQFTLTDQAMQGKKKKSRNLVHKEEVSLNVLKQLWRSEDDTEGEDFFVRYVDLKWSETSVGVSHRWNLADRLVFVVVSSGLYKACLGIFASSPGSNSLL